MRENNLSAAQLSLMLGLADKSTLYRYLNGTRKPSPEVMDKIHRLTQGRVTLSELVAQKCIRLAKAACRAEEERRRQKQALYCGFSEQFIQRQDMAEIRDLPVWQKWDLYYGANDNLPFPVWQASQIFGSRFRFEANGQYWLDGKRISPKQLITNANQWLQTQGHVPICYPTVNSSPSADPKSTSRPTLKSQTQA